MTHRDKALLQASMFLLSFACSRSRGADEKFEKQAAALLLQRYETVVSTRSKVFSRLHLDNPNQDFGRKVLGLPFIYLMGGLKAVGPNTLGTMEAGSDSVLTGAKDFVGPAGLGMVSSHTCSIAILAPGAARTLAPEFSKVKVEPMDGRPVWTWSVPPSEGYQTPISFYAAIVTSSFFVLTNNEEDFRETANALANGKVQGDLLTGPDLTSLRANAYWAHRTIRRTEGVDASESSGLRRLPASAAALELFTQFDDGKLFFNVRVLNDRPGVTPAGLPSSESIRFERAGAGVWQAIISLTTSQTTYALYQVLSYFGYGVAL
jgi:hypothetical protein